MSYKVKTDKEYKQMISDESISELRLWLEDQLDNHRAVLRAVTGVIPESDSDIDEALGADFTELPTMINDYEDGTVAKFIVKYRLENNLTETDDSLLDLDDIGNIITNDLLGNCDSDEDINTIRAHKSFASDMITICQIFCFEDLRKSFEAWHP